MNATMPIEVQRFPSHTTLRSEHLELLKTFTSGGETASHAPQIKDFIQRGVATGAILDSDADRQSAQSVLDYWDTRLYRLTSEEVESSLADFDPSLAPKLEDALCPYVGLEPFSEAKQDAFFGRQTLAAELVERLKKERMLIVVGSSGSGKSSLVRAGLLPAMKKGAFPPEKWQYLPPIVPGADPQIALPELLKQGLGGDLVIVVDQFEEVFTLATEEESRQVEQMLMELIENPDHEHRIILTLRTDFVSQMARLEKLNQEKYKAYVPPLAAAELREAIQAPADRIGLKFEDGIVDSLLNEILGEPAALPLLQFTLLRLWEKRDHNRITWKAYDELGRGRKALENSATEFYEKTLKTKEQQDVAKEILLRMVRPGEGLEVTSNRVQRKELLFKNYAADRVEDVLNRFEKAHLLRVTPGKTRDEDWIEVAHEALIRNWSKLGEWLETERVRLQERSRLRAAAELWQERGRDASLLYRGAVLEEAAKFEHLNDTEAAFMRTSLAVKRADEEAAEAARLREIQEAKRTAKIASSGVISAGLLIPLVVSMIWLVVADAAILPTILVFVLLPAMLIMNIRVLYLSLGKLFSGGGAVHPDRPAAVSEAVRSAGPPVAANAVRLDEPAATVGDSGVTWKDTLLSAAFYIFFPVNFFVLLMKRRSLSRFARFHVIQSVVMDIILLFISSILVFTIMADTGSTAATVFVLYLLVGYFWVFFFAIQSGRGKYIKLPLIGNWILKSMDGKAQAMAAG